MPTLKEDELRRSGGEDKGLILVTYSVPPEHAVVDYLSENLPLTSLLDRKIDVPVIHGHPLFQEGISRQGPERLFPKIGVEWVQDSFTEYLGLNEKHFRNTSEFIDYLNEIKQIPDTRRLATDKFLEQFSSSKFYQQFQHLTTSEIAITGFASGGPSERRTAQWMFEITSSLMQPLQHDFGKLYPGAEVLLPESSIVNLETEELGQPIFGFEISIRIVQVRSIFRAKPKFLFPRVRKITATFE
ncbi:hypothetical protein LEP1GSC050_0104 [Leptospira phage vB_LbrZ_5399-LE1]|uniref:Uncharacterized protein n=1 Tax=Leptospira inadai serovar Lyme TaxID=293084 RepID=A0ABX4YGG6_9LEPT|nr:hypothetical protein [Leptospira inadai]AGS80691.1 hypothetical protein LEP1GSC050_0104 [Leptospira phage vB_LbrZ_5399-LE1]AGS80847.1 hypothetical protein LEP1GSC047_0868 [Leptospira phage vB_LinZ_10-LE1]PNV74362.1 hypothetical protein BES34_014355 [Leptospira inadai serovar Lyme]